MRRITLFVSAIVVALFATVTVTSSRVNAQEAEAVWEGSNIVFGGDTYERADPKPDNDPTFYASPCGKRNHVYTDIVRDDSGAVNGTHVICFDDSTTDTVMFVWFPNARTDPDTNRFTYGTLTEEEKDRAVDFQNAYQVDQLPTSSDINDGKVEVKVKDIELPDWTVEQYDALYEKYFENIRDYRNDIALDGTVPATATAGDEAATISTCDSRYTHGLGWIVCPVTNLLADFMDEVYKILSSFLIVSPLATDRTGPLYYMWGVMQNFANVLFIIGFLVIIYSQITGYGLSNYGIKRLLPRLAIAAVLVNISYWVCALAVDLSNILGVSLQDMFVSIRENIPASEATDLGRQDPTWKALATTILAGGALTGGFLYSAVASAGGSLWFLLVGVVGVMVSGLVAVLILAARQALITILIIISPLAFVAYLLPSTEKYFDRWRGIFTTMLVMFPIFSIVFGGANLAGVAIIYTADPGNANYYNVIILGMIVQIAPLIITPLLLKLSGSLLGRVAGIVNDPNKGVIDSTRKFAQRRHDMTKNRQLWDRDKDTNELRNTNFLARGGRRIALREIDGNRKLKAWESGADAAYANDHRYHDSHMQSELNTMNKNVGEQTAKRDLAAQISNTEALKTLDAMSRLTQQEAALAENRNKTFYEAMQAKPGIVSAAIRNIGGTEEMVRRFEEMAQKAQDTSYAEKRETYRQNSISGALNDSYHKGVTENREWQDYAGASEIDAFGAQRVQTIAQSEMIAASNKRVENYQKRFGFENTDPGIILGKATGAIKVADEEEQEAAIRTIGASNNSDHILRMTEELDFSKASTTIRQAYADAMKASGARPVFVTMGRLGYDVPQGQNLPPHGALVDEWSIDALNKHKFDTKALADKATKDEVLRLHKTLIDNGGRARLAPGVEARLREDIKRAFKDPEMFRGLGDKLDPLRTLGSQLGMSADDFRPGAPDS